MSPSIPKDHCRQTRATDLVETLVKSHGFDPKNVVDLGCGTGASQRFFKRVSPKASWTGVDIESSPEVSARVDVGDQFLTFDGVNIPLADNSVDLVYCNQVLEHVRYPEELLADVTRILSKDGYFIGQTSQFEPYHSFSFWNFTIFGFKQICEQAGLSLDEIRPGIDGFTLMERSYLGRPKEMSRWFGEESPRNQDIETQALSSGFSIQKRNWRKLLYCGQFAFRCTLAP